MTKKIIRLTENNLLHIVEGAVRKILKEGEIVSNTNEGKYTIRTFSTAKEEDLRFLSARSKEMYEILTNSYESIGGPIGLEKDEDVINRSSIIKLGFADDGTIIAVVMYSDHLGGNKFSYGGAVMGNYHDLGKQCLEAIVVENIETIKEFYWIEASGALENWFRKHNAFNLPSRYVSTIFKWQKIEIIDEYYYQRSIAHKEPCVKTIFGFNNEQTLKKVFNDFYGYLLDDIEEMYNQLRGIKEGREENLSNYPPQVEIACSMVYLFEENLYEGEVKELPLSIISHLKRAVDYLNHISQKDSRVMNAIRSGENLLSSIETVQVVHNGTIVSLDMR